jgi:hypothetical protein
MRKNLLSIALLTCSAMASAQVGINTTAPQNTFHVDGAKDNNQSGVPTAIQQSNDFIVTKTAGIGIGTVTPSESAALDITSENKALLLPRVANTALITTPVNGMLIYDTSEECFKGYSNGRWTGCITFAPSLASLYPEGSVFCATGPTKIVDVLSPTGKTWMDRNLGATRAATSSQDAASYGDLYQWGRGSDGHQCRTSPTTATLSSTDQPGNGNFILVQQGLVRDWRSPENLNLWQGIDGINNPCPTGYRIPTEAELNTERLMFTSQDPAGAFSSALKLPLAGTRYFFNGLINEADFISNVWSSQPLDFLGSNQANALYFKSKPYEVGQDIAFINNLERAWGCSVRCIKD